MGHVANRGDGPSGPDPRPRAVSHDGAVLLRGWRCADCALARAVPAPRCPACGGSLRDAEFGPEGTVWSSTIVHLDIDEIDAPYGLAYVDVDDGPRLLAHTAATTSPIDVGTRVAITGMTQRGDIQVVALDAEPAA